MTHPNYLREYKKERMLFPLVILGVLVTMIGIGVSSIALIIGGCMAVVMCKLVGNTIDTRAAKLMHTWRELGLGTLETFPATDYQRKAYCTFAKRVLYEQARRLAEAVLRNEAASAARASWRMPEPIPVVNETGGALMRQEEREATARRTELEKELTASARALTVLEKKLQQHWEFFKGMSIGDGVAMPKNMLPVHPDGGHWQHASAFRQFVADRITSGLSPEPGATPSADV